MCRAEQAVFSRSLAPLSRSSQSADSRACDGLEGLELDQLGDSDCGVCPGPGEDHRHRPDSRTQTLSPSPKSWGTPLSPRGPLGSPPDRDRGYGASSSPAAAGRAHEGGLPSRAPGRPDPSSPPPPSPASSLAREGGALDHAVEDLPKAADLSSASAVSSEPRYHCLGDGGSPIPAWDDATGLAEGDAVLGVTGSVGWERDAAGFLTPGVISGAASDGSPPPGDGPSDSGLGAVAEEGDTSWWALSDESFG